MRTSFLSLSLSLCLLQIPTRESQGDRTSKLIVRRVTTTCRGRGGVADDRPFRRGPRREACTTIGGTTRAPSTRRGVVYARRAPLPISFVRARPSHPPSSSPRGRLALSPRRSSIRERRDARCPPCAATWFYWPNNAYDKHPYFHPSRSLSSPADPPPPFSRERESPVTRRCVVTTLPLSLSPARAFSHPFSLSISRPFAAARRHFAREERR